MVVKKCACVAEATFDCLSINSYLMKGISQEAAELALRVSIRYLLSCEHQDAYTRAYPDSTIQRYVRCAIHARIIRVNNGKIEAVAYAVASRDSYLSTRTICARVVALR